MPVHDLETCKVAAEKINIGTNMGFHWALESAHVPKGCHFNGVDGIYFNRHLTGGRHEATRQVCKPTGEVDNTITSY